MTRSEIFSFVDRHTLGVLSSVAEDGTPQSALVGFACTPDFEIIFDTVRSSRKYANLSSRPGAAFVIGWEGEITVQYEGLAEEPFGEELRRSQDAYFRKWPDGPARLSWPEITYFRVRPRWVRYSDYYQNPAFIAEVRF